MKLPKFKNDNEAILWFRTHPPKYYVWFYDFFKNVLKWVIWFLMVLLVILGLVHKETNLDLSNYLLADFFTLMGITVFAMVSVIYKNIYIRKFAKEAGIPLDEWNEIAKGIEWDI